MGNGRGRARTRVEANAVWKRAAPARSVIVRATRTACNLDRVIQRRGLVPGCPAPRAGCRVSPPSSPRHERSATRPLHPRRPRSNLPHRPGASHRRTRSPRRVIRTLWSKDTDQRSAPGCDALAAPSWPSERPAGQKVENTQQQQLSAKAHRTSFSSVRRPSTHLKEVHD